jgi:hypothetical protein
VTARLIGFVLLALVLVPAYLALASRPRSWDRQRAMDIVNGERR